MSKPKAALLSRQSSKSLLETDARPFAFPSVPRDKTGQGQAWWRPSQERLPVKSLSEPVADRSLLENDADADFNEADLFAGETNQVALDEQDSLGLDDLDLGDLDGLDDMAGLDAVLSGDGLSNEEQAPEVIQQQAYDSGYQAGLQAAQQQIQQEAVEQGLQQGHQEGLDAGRKEGYETGFQEGVKQLQGQQQILESVLEHAEPWASALLPSQMESMVQLIESIVRQVVLVERVQARGAISRAVLAGLEQMVDTAGKIRIELNPGDHAEVKSLEQKEQANWELVPDPSITKGGCRIYSDDVIVDSTQERRLESALAAVRASFMAENDEQQEDPVDNFLADYPSDFEPPALPEPEQKAEPEQKVEPAQNPDHSSLPEKQGNQIPESNGVSPASGNQQTATPAETNSSDQSADASPDETKSSGASASLGAWGSLGQ
ncbi:FliH/SctL family protein [Spongorhabdus nitratireducens]